MRGYPVFRVPTHVSHDSGSRLSVRKGSGATTRVHDSLWAAIPRYKEMFSWPSYTTRPVRRADRWEQCSVGFVDHSHDTVTVCDDPTGRRQTVDRAQCGRAMGLDVPHATEDIISYSYPLRP
jgi:hypothetical protein